MVTSCVAFYPCVSLAETEKFYTEIIGLGLAFAGENSRIFSCGGGGYFGFVEYPEKRAEPGKLCLSLNCGSEKEVDEEYHRVIACGGKPQNEPAQHSTQPVYSFFLRDPSGYLVEFQKVMGTML